MIARRCHQQRLGAAAILATLGILLSSTPASAHAVLTRSEPEDGTTIRSAPSEVVLDFTEPIDSRASSVTVLDTAGSNVAQPIVARDADTLEVPVALSDRTVYVVTWRVLSRVDGHVTAGTVAFGVGIAPGDVERPADADGTPGATPLGVGSRALFYLGALLLAGAALMSWIGPGGRATAVAAVGSVSAFLGSLGIAESQRQDLRVSIGDALGTSIGRGLFWRLIPLVIVAGAIAWSVRSRRARPLLAIAAFILAAAHVALGHAAATSTPVASILIQTMHLSAVAVWIGGLAALLIGVVRADPGERALVVRRYSFVAGLALAIVAATGAWRAFEETRSWQALTGTTFGRIVVAKVVLLLLLAALGGLNRWRNVPRAGESLTGLRRVGFLELCVAGLVLSLTAVMASIAPARIALTERDTADSGIAAIGTDFAETTQAQLSVSPGRPGPNEYRLALTETLSGEPLDARRVSLTFRYVGRPELASSTVDLERQEDGSYTSAGSELAFGGVWSATVVAEGESRSTQVGLSIGLIGDFATQTIVTAGQPTIFDVQLPRGGSVQFYVDPPLPEAAEVHATFFDAQGRELGGLADLVLVATPPDADASDGPRSVPLRLLTPGHFVASVDLTSGEWRFDVAAETRRGDLVWAYFTEQIP